MFILSAGFTTYRNKDLEIVKNLDIYCTLFRELNMFYVDEVPPEKLITSSINAMLKSLDPYTVYIPEKEKDNFNFQTTGEYGGIGSLIRRSGEKIIIADPYEGFPAANSGLQAGDIFLEVEGKSTREMEISDVSDLLKGLPGTDLKLKMKRPYADSAFSLSLTREKIVISNVSYSGMLDDKTGYIRLSNFTTNASKEVRAAFLELKQNPNFEQLILDLRWNPGGLMIEAVRTANLFIDKGELIVSTKGKVKRWDSEYKTTNEPLDTEIPIVVMINRSSASAAEIVAGAIQDLDRGILVGQRTFGKGLVQTTRPLKYDAQLKVTTAKYYIPSGRCIQALDYANRNEDGSVGHVPDSLITAYKTRNGRTVYDGGGVQPDVEIVPEPLSEIALRLFAQQMIFDYATLFRVENPGISSAGEFSLDNADFQAFKSFVAERDFEFETASEKAFNKLVETAKKEKYYALSESEFDALRNKLDHSNEEDMETFRTEIVQMIEEEVVSRYYYHKGKISKNLQRDEQLKKGLELVNDPVQLMAILAGKAGALAKISTGENNDQVSGN